MWRVFILALLILMGIIGYIFYDVNNFIVNSVTIIGWILFFMQTVITTFPQAKLFITRIKIHIYNPTINWSLSVIHNFDALEDKTKDITFKNIEDYLNDLKEFKIVKKNKSTAVYTIRGYMIRVVIEEDYGSIRIEIGDKDISYRESLKIMDKLSLPLEKLYMVMKSDSQEYYISMRLENNNPFRGVLINNLSEIEIESFRVKFRSTNGMIDVYNNDIEIFATSISDISKLSKSYLHVSTKE